jgi:glycosyltransferase involved in cell wall biosynthesis
MTPARVSAVVPTFRRLDTLRRCLTGLRISDHRFVEIIVVVRPSADPETLLWLTAQLSLAPELKLITVDVPGQVAALNAGLDAANGDFIAFFDDDALPNPDWLRRLLKIMQDPHVAVAGGRDRLHERGRVIEGMAKYAGVRNWFGVLRGEHHLAYGAARLVDSIKGCNFLVRKAALGSLRFDPRLLGQGAQYRNESWFCANLIQAGWHIVLSPEVSVDHFAADRADGARKNYSADNCFNHTANTVATDLAFASAWTKAKYLGYFVLIGHRYCPGIYYTLHALVRRPWALAAMLHGGWSGFNAGLKLAKSFRIEPPGIAIRWHPS